MTKSAVEDFSRSFYPFLHKERKRPEELMKEMTFSLIEKVRDSVSVKQQFFQENKDQILNVSLALAQVVRLDCERPGDGFVGTSVKGQVRRFSCLLQIGGS